MSHYKCMKRRGRKARRSRIRHFFDTWSRNESDSLRWKLVQALTASYEDTDQVGSFTGLPFDYFSNLAEVEWSSLDSSAALPYPLVQLRALFSKDEDMRSPIDKEDVAWKSFLLSEEECKATNDRLRNGISLSGVESIMFMAQRKISSILGDCPKIADLALTFGPGASTSCRRKTSARWKLSTIPSISSSAVNVISELAATLPRYTQLHKNEFRVMLGELEFVPKNYKTKRAIVIEPTLNGMAQRGIGSVMKRKLHRAGIDLSDQTINKCRARQGSLTGDLCTMDLERASDSLSFGLVLELLPFDWFELLNTFRTPAVRYSKTGTVIELEKFSSMGNGYTFELESLIFYSLAHAISAYHDIPLDVSVYGDDLIVTAPLFEQIENYFPLLGFTVNRGKSFSSGFFRESCGGDFFFGLDVRPFFIRGRFTNARVVGFYNFLTRKPQFDPLRKLRDILLESIPQNQRNWGPDGFGDGHLISGAHPRTYLKPHKRDFGWSGFTFHTYAKIPKRDKRMCVGDSELPSYSAGMTISDFSSVKSELASSTLLELKSASLDHHILRDIENARGKMKKVRVYILDPS